MPCRHTPIIPTSFHYFLHISHTYGFFSSVFSSVFNSKYSYVWEIFICNSMYPYVWEIYASAVWYRSGGCGPTNNSTQNRIHNFVGVRKHSRAQEAHTDIDLNHTH